MKALQWEYGAGTITWEEVKTSLQAWNAHVEHGTTWQLRREVFGNTSFVRSQ